MHDVLRQRVMRRLETLPEAQMYQVLDYIEFLESKYARDLAQEASGLQKFAENLEDRLRRRAVNPANIREAFQLISAADRVLSSVSKAGKELLDELNVTGELPAEGASGRADSDRGGLDRPGGPASGPAVDGGSASDRPAGEPPVGGGRPRPSPPVGGSRSGPAAPSPAEGAAPENDPDGGTPGGP